MCGADGRRRVGIRQGRAVARVNDTDDGCERTRGPSARAALACLQRSGRVRTAALAAAALPLRTADAPSARGAAGALAGAAPATARRAPCAVVLTVTLDAALEAGRWAPLAGPGQSGVRGRAREPSIDDRVATDEAARASACTALDARTAGVRGGIRCGFRVRRRPSFGRHGRVLANRDRARACGRARESGDG